MKGNQVLRAEYTGFTADTGDARVPESSVQAQLQRILSSRLFLRAPQAGRLLTFLVEETLSGGGAASGNNLKEYSIAVRVFGRAPGFDPAADNIVRVEVRRVRSKLDSYYAEEGASDPILITIPKGAYVPEFQIRDECDVDLSGRTISHYDLVRRTCANAWQTCYDANCLHLRRPVMLIVPSRRATDDESRRERLLESVRSAVVDHPNVAAIHDVESINSRVLIGVATRPGQPLRQIADQSALSGGEALHFARQLASALASGHEAGIFHGNLHPDSVSIDLGAQPHLFPFGVSPLVDTGYHGFDGFRPPEWSRSYEPDLRSDVWSFGALVWFACHGTPPPAGIDAMAAAAEAGPMPPQLAAVITRCLQADPSSRYASATEIAADLATVASSPAPEVPAAPAEPASKVRDTIVTTALLLGLLSVVLIASVVRHTNAPGLTDVRAVVLPFDNIGDNPETDPYCRAITELLGTKLTRLPGIRVISSRSLDPKRGRISTEFLRQQLRVDYAVDGTLLKTETGFEATVRMIRVADGSFAWTESYRGPWREISVRMDEVAEKAAATMGIIVQRELDRLTPSRQPPEAAAYDAWLKGRFAAIEYWNTLQPDYFDDAERRLLRAMELQPVYPDAMVDLAQLYVSAFYPPRHNQRELFRKAEELAERAVVLEPDSGPAQAVLGSVYTDTGRARLAMPHLRRAVQLSPDDPNPRNYLSIAYEAMGFWESSLVEREKAIERDPMLRGIRGGGALMLARLGQVDRAFRVAEMLEAGSPAWGLKVAHIYLLTGEPGRAEEVLTKTEPREPANLVTAFKESMALAQAEQGRSEMAKQSLRNVSVTQLRRSEIAVLLCAAAGEKDLLVDRIAKHPYIRNYRWLVSERRLRPYRSYPPFQKLVHEIAQEWEQNLRDFGASLPVNPPKLPGAEEYLNQQ